MAVIANLSTLDPLLAAELKHWSAFYTQVNQIHLQHLNAIGMGGSNRVVSHFTELHTESGLESSVDKNTLGDDVEFQWVTFMDFMLAIKNWVYRQIM